MDKEKSGGGGAGGGGPAHSTSKAYSSHLAVQTDAAKYRNKYKELKRKVRQIEAENDKLHFKTLRIKRNIQRMRLERAILYERLESELTENAAATEVEPTHQGGQRSHADSHEPRSSHGNAQTQPAQSTPSSRRAFDYSPSPEDTKAPNDNHAPTGNGDGRQGMKVTLKRNSHANGKDSSW